MELSAYKRRPAKRAVFHQEMPTTWAERLPSAEEVWIGGHKVDDGLKGWILSPMMEKDGTGNGVLRHYRWNLSSNFSPILQEIMDYHDCDDISMFIGHCEGQNSTLGWHFDDYYVWAFNIEGVTEWQWFCCQSGEIKKQVLEPGYILTMPLGVTHRVEMLSEHRTSISIITRFGVPTMRVPKENENG